MRRKISVLNYDISNNSLGRAYILGKALSEYYDVQIIGPGRKDDTWEPLREADVEIKRIPYSRFPILFFQLFKILRSINGDLIYAIKPRFTSFGYGLLRKMVSGKPLILDIDDWEVGFHLRKGFWSRLSRFVHITNPYGFFWTWVMQFFIGYSDKVTTVSTFLKEKYGGEILLHAKDTDFLDPEKFVNDNLRRKLGLEKKKTVVFLGTPKPYKGVEDALRAVLMIKNPDVLMIIVGADLRGEYEKKLKRMGGDRLFLLDAISYRELPRYLMIADVVVIPQSETYDTIGQIPSKLFDAMSMAKPIISTRVSDIPEIIDGCGIIVNPDRPEELCSAIKWVFDHYDESRKMGLTARKNCIERYSLNILKERLKKLVEEVIEKSNKGVNKFDS